MLLRHRHVGRGSVFAAHCTTTSIFSVYAQGNYGNQTVDGLIAESLAVETKREHT
jgi:hypothetical protein